MNQSGAVPKTVAKLLMQIICKDSERARLTVSARGGGSDRIRRYSTLLAVKQVWARVGTLT